MNFLHDCPNCSRSPIPTEHSDSGAAPVSPTDLDDCDTIANKLGYIGVDVATPLIAELRAARAREQRVREWCARFMPDGYAALVRAILDILDEGGPR